MRGNHVRRPTSTSKVNRWGIIVCSLGLTLVFGIAAAAAVSSSGGSPSADRADKHVSTSSDWRCWRLGTIRDATVAPAKKSWRGHRYPCRTNGTPRPTATSTIPTTPTTPATTEPTTVPTTTPTADPANGKTGCATDPSSCGYPDESNSGVPKGTTLVRVPQDVTSGRGWHYDARGWIEVDGDGATLAGITTTRNVNVTAPNVTVENSRIIVSGEDFGISVRHAANVTLRNNDVAGPSASGPTRLMVGIKDIYSDSANLKVLGNNIWNTATGVQTDQGLIEDNYIHDLGFTGSDHVNGTTSNGGSRMLTIRHNTIFNPHDQTDAVSLFQDFGPQGNRVIDDNLLAGGGYTIYAGANPGKASTATNISVTNNRISRIFYPGGGYFGYATAYTSGGGNSWSGNVWDDTGVPIPAP